MLFMIVLQIVLIALNAIFACAEIAVISMNDTKLAKMVAEGDKRAVRLARLTSQPARFLATIQVAITLSGFLGSAFAAENFSGVLVDWLVSLKVPVDPEILDSIAVVFITLLLSYFTLVFGELVPKQVAMRNAEKLALGMSGLISGIATVFRPLVSLLTASTNGVLRLLGIDPNAQEDAVSEEEIRMMVDAGSEKGTIDSAEREFIQNVFEFDNIPIRDIVTHRTELTMLFLEDTMDAWEDTVQHTWFTYYPVCKETPDHIVGVLNSKSYLRLKDRSRENVMKEAVEHAYIVPETLMADVLFKNMRRDRARIAVVLDEYGGLSGIITLRDLLEELVGDLADETEAQEELSDLVQTEDNLWDVDGSILLETLTEKLGICLECEEYDTLNGLIFHHLGTSPEAGDTLNIENVHITVTQVENYQVLRAILHISSAGT